MPHQIDRIVAAVESAIWAIHEPKLQEIAAFLDMRANMGWEDYRSVRAAFVPALGPEIFRDNEGRRIDVDGIRLVSLMGLLIPKANMLSEFSGGTSMAKFSRDFSQAVMDDSIRTILIYVDSPGGEGGGIAEASQLIRQARGDKRIVAFVEGMMGSAALWVGTSATVVVASRSADIGSQGVFAIHTETSKKDAAKGVTKTLIRSEQSPDKAAANKIEPLSDKGLADIQRQVNDMNRMFVSDLALNRGVSEKVVLNSFGRGAIFMAAEARERGMIDDVLLFSEFIDQERRLNANRTSVSVGGSQQMNVSTRVKAALFANGIIESMEVSDAECVAYLRGVCSARNLKLEDQSDDALVKMVQITELKPGDPKQKTVGIGADGKEYVTDVVEPARDAEALRDTALAEERARRAEITAAARTLGIPDREILAAHENNTSVEEARELFKTLAAKHNGPVSIVGGDASIDKFAMGVTGSFLERAGHEDKISSDERSYGFGLRDATLMEIARSTLEMHGMRPSGDRRTDARAFLAVGTQGEEPTKIVSGPDGSVQKLLVGTADPVANRRGDFPDALSNLMGKLLDIGYAQARRTFEVYTKSIPDVPDFKPKTFIETAVFQELDLIGEDEPHQQLRFENAIKAMIEVVRYGNKVGLTIEMVVDDDLGAFASQLESLARAAGDTVDNSCRTMLTCNPTMLDGTALFHADHNNLITSGGVPSATQAKEHRRVHRLIKGFGSSRPMNLPPVAALCPAALEEDALQTFTFFGDPKVAQTDSTINTHRGTVQPTIDSMLDAFSTAIWYTFSDPVLAPIAKAHLRGSGGMAGTRTTWSDPDTGSRYVALDMTLGLTPLNFRGAVKNPGT